MKQPELAYALASFPPELLEAAQRASASLADAGVPHAMCGGLAVGAYGVADFELDVELIVGDEAFTEIDGLRVVRSCVPVAFASAVGRQLAGAPSAGRQLAGAAVPVAVPISIAWLERGLHSLRSAVCEPFETDGVRVLAPEALIALRLARPRRQHLADIRALVANGSVDVAPCRAWLASRGFDVSIFDYVVRSLATQADEVRA